MSAENPTISLHFKKLMRESHRLAVQMGGDPEIMEDLFILCRTLLDACEAGIFRDEIEKTLTEGWHHGALQLVDPSLTPAYWEAVDQEIEDTDRNSE